MKTYIKHLCLLVLTAALIFSCSDNGGEEASLKSSFTIKQFSNIPLQFAPNQTVTYEVEAVNIVKTFIYQPAGWRVDYDETTLSITAPQSNNGADSQGDITIKYTGADGVSGQIVIKVEVTFDEPDTPDNPQGPDNPSNSDSFQLIAAPNGNSIEYVITPEDPTTPYQITLDTKLSFLGYGSEEEYMKFDIQYWQNEYGANYTQTLVSGMQAGVFEDIPDGTYILCTYYVDVQTSTGYGFTKQEVVINTGSGDNPGEDVEPHLGLAYEIGDGAPFGYPNQGVVVCYVDPNQYVADWYYGIFRPENCNGHSDDDIRAGLKSLEELHGKTVLVYPYDWNTEVVLCGFYIDANGNEGPIERIPLIVSLNPSADCNYDDYIGDWVVSGTGVRGNQVSYDITISENMRDDSFNIFGLTHTGKDVANNAPVKVAFKNGALVFYESSTLGIDRQTGNWLGFLGYAYDKANPNNKGYFNINSQTIATGIRSGNSILLDWKTFTYETYSLKYYTFVYGFFTEDEYRNEYFYLYDEDLTDYIVSNMTITKKDSTAPATKKALKGFTRRSSAK